MAARLADTVALITGSGSAIGTATARRLAAEGAAVALVARRPDRLHELASAISGDGGTAVVVPADVTRQPEAVGAVERTIAQLGRLDTVVNSAGIMLRGPAPDVCTDEWDQMVALNVRGLLYVTHAALLHLVRAANDSPRGVADLVNISSTPGGIIAFSDAIRQELPGQRVRVSVVEPGTVVARCRTGSFEVMRPDDIADAVAYIVTRDPGS